MKLRAVTITGADDTTQPASLLQVSREFPFVEWGVLLSANRRARSRYPSDEWIASLELAVQPGVCVSGHLCGTWVRQVCGGVFPPAAKRAMFGRVQLNVSTMVDTVKDSAKMAACLPQGKEYIVQVGEPVNRGLALADKLRTLHRQVGVLFDASGGRGQTPPSWPESRSTLPCGFAGGLGPDNLQRELERLAAIVGDAVIWIDMESGVRAEDNSQLDLDKVRRVLELARQWAIS